MEGDASAEPRQVLYCGVCGWPTEYCEFNPDFDECLPWLKKHDPSRVETEEQVAAMLDMCDQVRKKHKLKPIERDGEKADGQQEDGSGKAAQPKKKKRTPRVTVSRVQRSKRKFLTLVSGLDAYGVQGKEACSLFKKKFACGVSVVKGTTDIEIQGDVSYEIVDFIVATWPEIREKYVRFGQDGRR